MIPVTKENITIIDLERKNVSKSERKYIDLLKDQLYWLNRNSEKFLGRAESLYLKYVNGTLAKNIMARCCNYVLLEKKCREYSTKFKSKD